ncbi:hypothetical protein AB0J80_17525 [Actinoplanes sp. NPDC049548]|uniref:CdiA C-terminal domain-containing protein n=1 Tax=Actinoplanes sp. NPDC049548 TaxID=3155152 RepID=UPI00342510B4
MDPNQRAEARRSLDRENSGAQILAALGYRVTQNPTPDEVLRARQITGDDGDPSSRPDYLVEGRVFDCYSPATDTGVRSVWTEVRKKVRRDQTQRVIVNLEDWGGDLTTLRQQFGDWPIDRLKEVKAITRDGDIVQIVPEP